jgi:ATP-dependent helicase Lhr and Lhr-like helicase
MALESFDPVIRRWFEARFGAPTAPQIAGWPPIREGKDTLIAAPTGSGKTLAAFLSALDDLVAHGASGLLEEKTLVLYVSPLKALSNDVSKNLQSPLEEIRALALSHGTAIPEITVSVRTGDTPQSDRAKMAKHAPHILVTTPESLFILLTAEKARERLAFVKTVILDEIHAIADDKRGAHLSISLERLDALVLARTGRLPQRIGLSATQKPIEEIARLLSGSGRAPPVICDAGFRRGLDLAIEVPTDELGAVASHEMMEEVYARIAGLASQHRTTLVFVNTRRLVERVAHRLADRMGEGAVAAHHGSLSRATRLLAEQRLKNAEVKVAVATASLELGIDIGAVELVIQIGSPRSIATFLQRVGRSGHSLGATPKGRLFALTRDQLVECAALIRAVDKGELDAIAVPDAPLDILAQQIVAACATDEWREDALFDLVRRAYPYRKLTRERFEQVVAMLADGVAPERGRSRSYLHRDRIHGTVRARRGARMTAIMSGGAIPDTADYAVIAEPDETFVGTLHEDFAIESMAGDIFLLGNTSWRIRRVEAGRVRVEDAKGAPPTIPFWLGEAPARTAELSHEVSELRGEIEAKLAGGIDDRALSGWIQESVHVEARGADQIVEYLAAARNALGALPTDHLIIAERFFDEAGGMQLVLHAPLGGRINRAWGLALRKRFCRSFNFELQAAATDDGIVISLGPMHSFPLESVFEFLSPESVLEVLEQAVLAAPIFGVRWRWNAQRALAVPRFQGGKKVPPPILRMRTDDLLSAVFPMVQACQENVVGDIELPDHPLILETMRNCLEEAMDAEGLRALITAIRGGGVRVLARDTAEASPISHEILNANPYAYLDDAPLEERRARAVNLRRRGLHPETADGIGALDPDAIATAEAEAQPEPRDADELHDLLLSVGLLATPLPWAADWDALFEALVRSGRATRVAYSSALADDGPLRGGEDRVGWIAWERKKLVEAALGPRLGAFEPEHPPLAFAVPPIEPHAARIQIVRGHLEVMGPRTAGELSAVLGLPKEEVDEALFALEAEGAILRGRFRPQRSEGEGVEWCDRRILARIHRLTIGRLRREIEPVTPADLMRFLFCWQHVAPDTQLSDARGTLEIVAQLEGLELQAAAWERDVLPARIRSYDPRHLDALTFAGEVAWGRLAPRDPGDGSSLSRNIPIAVVLRDDLPWLLDPLTEGSGHPGELGHAARDVLACLEQRGASFLREIMQATKRLPTEIEEALRELVHAGLVTADGFSGLRALLDRRLGERNRSSAGGGTTRSMAVDRWRFDKKYTIQRDGGRDKASRDAITGGRWSLFRSGVEVQPSIEARAKMLLLRWGVVFRDLVQRESRALAWRDLLVVLRRMEARGEVRGGRFVSGFVGEQYAMPEAVDSLRAMRRKRHDGPELIRVAATDPLNLTGIVTPSPRVPAVSGNLILYRDGVPIAARESSRIVLKSELEPGESIDLELRLSKRSLAAAQGATPSSERTAEDRMSDASHPG